MEPKCRLYLPKVSPFSELQSVKETKKLIHLQHYVLSFKNNNSVL
jgi:hypothetical protein